MELNLKPKPLNTKEFEKFGKIISIENSKSKTINNGYAKKHYELTTIDSKEKNGQTALHIYLAKKREFPLKIDMLEKHPYFSQTFIPRGQNPFLLVVALGNEQPDLSTIKAFVTNGNEGVHYNRGVWHFPLISIEDNEQFIVIDRTDNNIKENSIEECIEFSIKNEKINLQKA
ncbi:ureidoglycolate hydrolase [Halarcobacter ebronensis]|uniref:Ureidoglycolate hydrolase n=1 Tax=Halarcobacter ebronensis TaxID=1462615 RepID=A0A4Q0YDE8_9BACT|nr:ureidoglycolate lyase [Halarcobacter ebronensis]RXJ68480.1 ureidoglycolate hydrolase [Halarcobacter ebronensis]